MGSSVGTILHGVEEARFGGNVVRPGRMQQDAIEKRQTASGSYLPVFPGGIRRVEACRQLPFWDDAPHHPTTATVRATPSPLIHMFMFSLCYCLLSFFYLAAFAPPPRLGRGSDGDGLPRKGVVQTLSSEGWSWIKKDGTGSRKSGNRIPFAMGDVVMKVGLRVRSPWFSAFLFPPSACRSMRRCGPVTRRGALAFIS